jgi:hypothetical protein
MVQSTNVQRSDALDPHGTGSRVSIAVTIAQRQKVPSMGLGAMQ